MLRVYLLGPLALDNGSRPLARLATHRAAGLLAYLVTHPGRAHPREALATLFWPDRPPENARRNLSTALWQIRHSLKRGGLDPSLFLAASGAAPWVRNWACRRVESQLLPRSPTLPPPLARRESARIHS